MFKRHKPDASRTAQNGRPVSAPGATSAPKPTGPAPAQKPAVPAGGHGAIFPAGNLPAGSAAKQPGTTDTSSSAKDSTTMGRAPFPATPGTPGTPGGPTPPSAAQGVSPGQRPSMMNRGDDRRTLVVGRGISVQGSVQDAERLVVEGTVESSMINAKELSVAPGGLFRGGVEVEDAEIAGTVDGTLTVRGSLLVASTGRLLGKATCKRLRVEDGGQISGQLEMLTDAAKDAPAPEAGNAA
ncbi:bactofilin family protein [Acetobacter fallax]|nr:polymer-forming cytoskeletal protein [Acetobacter fallax]